MATATAEHAERDEAVREATDRYERATHHAAREWAVTAEATAPFSEYRDDVSFKRREPDAEVQRTLTRELFERVEERGLVLEASCGGRGLVILRDPSIVAEAESARVALNGAKAKLEAFRHEHGAEGEAERKAAEAHAIREAIERDDPEAIREALAGPRHPRVMLRSEDVVPA